MLSEIRSFFSMMYAIIRRRYPMPWKTFFVTILWLVYLFSPIDFIPDMLPLLGITDDLTFMLLVLAMIRQDIARYRQFIAQRPDEKTVIDLGDISEHKK